MSQIIAIVNQKGGVGKTTTAINLSCLLSEEGHKVLLVDLDAQANATLGIGIKYQQLEHALYDALTGSCSLEEVVCPTVFEGLHVLPSSADLAALDVYLAGLESREYALKSCLAPLEPYYDYILLSFSYMHHFS